jgi:hypothetical protein
MGLPRPVHQQQGRRLTAPNQGQVAVEPG